MSDNKIRTNIADINKFYIMGEIDELLIEQIIVPFNIKVEQLVKDKNAVQEVEIYIDSNGGYYHCTSSLINLIELAKSKGITVKTIVLHRAYSAGSLIAISGSKGHRYIARNAEHLIHCGSFDGHTKHTEKQIDRTSEFYKRHLKKLVGLYKKYAVVPNLEKEIEDDHFFIPSKDCIKFKLADKYIEKL